MEFSTTTQLNRDTPASPPPASWSPVGDRVRLSPLAVPLISVRGGISSSLWRIGPAWVVAAAAWHARPAAWNAAFLLQLLSAVVLADAIWGIFWQVLRYDPAAVSIAPAARKRPARLPYALTDAPAARLWRWLADDAQPGHALQGWPLALLLSVLVAFPLGRTAVGLTLAVILVSLLGLVWIRRTRRAPASLLALLSVTLPWLLGQALVGPATATTLGLIAGFTLLVWGLLRCQQQAPLVWLTPLGTIVVVVTLILQPAPVAAGLTGFLGLIPYWYGLGQPAPIPAAHWAQMYPWLLATLLVAAGA
ncbi:MAG: hypothetical protein WAV74_09475 [Anaerolineae bacterium]